MPKLSKQRVYTDSNWGNNEWLFAYNEEFKYYAYIDANLFKKNKVVFKNAHHPENRGIPSKVGNSILTRATIVPV